MPKNNSSHRRMRCVHDTTGNGLARPRDGCDADESPGARRDAELANMWEDRVGSFAFPSDAPLRLPGCQVAMLAMCCSCQYQSRTGRDGNSGSQRRAASGIRTKTSRSLLLVLRTFSFPRSCPLPGTLFSFFFFSLASFFLFVSARCLSCYLGPLSGGLLFNLDPTRNKTQPYKGQTEAAQGTIRYRG